MEVKYGFTLGILLRSDGSQTDADCAEWVLAHVEVGAGRPVS